MGPFRHLLCLAVFLTPTAASYSQQRIGELDHASAAFSPSDPARSLYVGLPAGRDAIAGISVTQASQIVRSDGPVSFRRRVDGQVVASSVSGDGRFVAILVLDTAYKGPTMSLEVLDERLKTRYRHPVDYQTDDPYPGITTGPDGSTVIAHHAVGGVDFISSSGELIARHSLVRSSHDIERAVIVSAASVTGDVAVAVNEPAAGRGLDVAARDVRIYSALGEEKERFALPPLTLRCLKISPSGGIVGVGSYDVRSDLYETAFYDRSGGMLHRSDFAAERIDFAALEDAAVIADKRQLAVVRPADAAELLRYRLDESSQRLLDASVSPDASYVVALSARTQFTPAGFVHDELRLHEFHPANAGEYAHHGTSLGMQAKSVRIEADTSGLGLSIDGATWWLGRK